MTMKKLTFLIIVLSCSFLFSQSQEVFILIDDDSNIVTNKAINDSIYLITFKFILDDEALYEFKRDENGNLIKKLIFEPNSNPVKQLEFMYKNDNKDNPPEIRGITKLKNILTFNDIKRAKDLKKLRLVLEGYKSIYIVFNENK